VADERSFSIEIFEKTQGILEKYEMLSEEE